MAQNQFALEEYFTILRPKPLLICFNWDLKQRVISRAWCAYKQTMYKVIFGLQTNPVEEIMSGSDLDLTVSDSDSDPEDFFWIWFRFWKIVRFWYASDPDT